MRSLCDQNIWQSQRGLKGLGKVLLKSPKGLRSVAGSNWSRAVFWAWTKDWPRLIWSLRGFIGRLEVSKRSYVSRRSVSDGAAIGFTTKSGDQLQRGFQACANHSAMHLQTSPTCLRMTASFRNKCSKRSDRLLKMVRKSSRKRDLLAIQDLNQYCLRLLLVNFLYSIVASIATFWFTVYRRSNCNCPVVNVLKTCKEMVRLWKASFLYAFVLI